MKRSILASLITVLLLLASCGTGIKYPFSVVNSPVQVEFVTREAGVVDATVSNSYLYVVRTLIDSEEMYAGVHTVVWDLLDEQGKHPGDGVYAIEVFLNGERIRLVVLEVLQ